VAAWGFWVFFVCAGVYVIAAGYTDLRVQRIPNYLTVPAAIVGLVLALLRGHIFQYPTSDFPPNLADCVLGFALGFGLFFIPFALGGGGSGDVKLVAALGALLGWYVLLFALAVSLIFAVIAAFVLWTTSFTSQRRKTKGSRVERRELSATQTLNPQLSTLNSPRPKARRRRAVPFAIPLALGTWCVLGMLALHELHPELFPADRSGRTPQQTNNTSQQ